MSTILVNDPRHVRHRYWVGTRPERRDRRIRRWPRSSLVVGTGTRVVVVLLTVDRAEALRLEQGGDIRDHARVPADVCREAAHRRDALPHQARDPPALAPPGSRGSRQCHLEREDGVSARERLELVLVIEVPLSAHPPEQGGRAATAPIEQVEQHGPDRRDARAGGDEEAVPPGNAL